MSAVVVVAPHPDDETIGCGGALLKHRDNGDHIYWLIVTCMSEGQDFGKTETEQRKQEIVKVSRAYGFEKNIDLNFPTKTLDQVPMEQLVDCVADCFRTIQPETVYLPNPGDAHTDHLITFQAAYSCTKVFRFPFIKRVLTYETLSETEFSANILFKPFVPNVFIDITSFLDKKIEIAKMYKGQFQEHPFPRSVQNLRALATLRGATANCVYAEGFYLVKSIE